jgi:hypothetical protein
MMVSMKRTLILLALAALSFCALLLGADMPVKFTRTGDRIEVRIGGKTFGSYYFGPNSPKPYFYPLTSPQGHILTRGYPMVKNIPGEDHDHPHHRAMYFAHGDINGVDFWGEGKPGKAQQTARGVYYRTSEELPHGRTEFRKLEEMQSRGDAGTLRALFALVGPDGKPMGSETQEYTLRGDATTRTIDCTFTITADQGFPLKMGDTKEGTFAIRVVKALEEPQVKMLNSNGAVGEKNIWGKRADWVDYSGTVQGEKVGIAIFDNPKNLRHPTTWHARGYGLFAVNPFGEHDFYNDPKRDGSYTIPAGHSLTLRYRVFIHEGDAAEAKVAEAYRQYAEGK